jgi:hypothetical protein
MVTIPPHPALSPETGGEGKEFTTIKVPLILCPRMVAYAERDKRVHRNRSPSSQRSIRRIRYIRECQIINCGANCKT